LPKQDSAGGGIPGVIKFADAPSATQTVDGGGMKFSWARVNLIFWGTEWGGYPPVTQQQVIDAVNRILGGPYMGPLRQYGVKGGSLAGTKTVSGSDPPQPFGSSNVSQFITGLIDDEQLPEPDEEWPGPLLHLVVMPSNRTYQPPPGGPQLNGWHSAVAWEDYDIGDIDNSNAHFGWVINKGTLNSITVPFSHELVEACTDADGSGVQVLPTSPSNWNEIGDVCNSTSAINGDLVQSYWSQSDKSCVVGADVPPPPPPPIRVRVTCVSKYFNANIKQYGISYIGGVDQSGTHVYMSRLDVLNHLFNGSSFYVVGDDGSQAEVAPQDDGHGMYIATIPDKSTRDNLLSLPHC
jgi:hypothetical protein